MNDYQYVIELAREIIKTKETTKSSYFELQSKDREFIQYMDKYIKIKIAKNTNALHIRIYAPLTSGESNPITYVNDDGNCYRNHGERISFILYAELLLGKERTMYFADWAKDKEQEIEKLFNI